MGNNNFSIGLLFFEKNTLKITRNEKRIFSVFNIDIKNVDEIKENLHGNSDIRINFLFINKDEKSNILNILHRDLKLKPILLVNPSEIEEIINFKNLIGFYSESYNCKLYIWEFFEEYMAKIPFIIGMDYQNSLNYGIKIHILREHLRLLEYQKFIHRLTEIKFYLTEIYKFNLFPSKFLSKERIQKGIELNYFKIRKEDYTNFKKKMNRTNNRIGEFNLWDGENNKNMNREVDEVVNLNIKMAKKAKIYTMTEEEMEDFDNRNNKNYIHSCTIKYPNGKEELFADVKNKEIEEFKKEELIEREQAVKKLKELELNFKEKNPNASLEELENFKMNLPKEEQIIEIIKVGYDKIKVNEEKEE